MKFNHEHTTSQTATTTTTFHSRLCLFEKVVTKEKLSSYNPINELHLKGQFLNAIKSPNITRKYVFCKRRTLKI